jgi:hypothetical protein
MNMRLHAAFAAARRGWPVFPLAPGAKQPRAGLTDWETRATTDVERIDRWWTDHPGDNIGIATGPAGLVVVDLDTARPGDTPPDEWPDARSGSDVYAALHRRHGHEVEPTWMMATPSGGAHLYYQAPNTGAPWRNTAGRLGWHIDTRAGGGYVIAAGSTTRAGRYTVIDTSPTAELPNWIADLLTPPTATPAGSPTRISRSAERRNSYVDAAIRGEVDRVLDAPVGQRNAALNRAAWNLARLIAAGLVPRTVVEDALCAAKQAAGSQSAAGVSATVRSAINTRLNKGIAS